MPIRGFHHLAIQVRSLEETAAFYRQVLGLAERERHHRPDGTLRSIWLDVPGTGGGFLALEETVLQGGRLGTNLLELGFLQEKDLARCLGKLHSCAFASGEMTPDPHALEQIDLQFADDKDVIPMRVDSTRISVAVIDPHD